MKKAVFFILLIVVYQLLTTSCTKRVQPELSAHEIPHRAENKELKENSLNIEKEKNTLKGFHPESSPHKIESHGENKKLKEFLDRGTEKVIDNNKTTTEEIIATARKYLGIPHCMGGTSLKCVDCSGLIFAVFAAHGIHLPHNSEDQARFGKIIPGRQELTRGDLVFFIKSYQTHHFITHAGIYMGNNEFLHSSSGFGVTITSLDDPWWKGKFIFGTRVLK